MRIADMAVTLDGISWEDYEAISQMKGERRSPRLLYSEGSLTLVGASPHQGESDDDISEMAVTLDDISWEDYEAISQMKGERRVPRLIYNQGSLTLVSPSYRHESFGDRLDRVVMTICEEFEIPCRPTVATRFRRDNLERGIEGDKTYYLANEARVRGKDVFDMAIDPPPDLAIEVEISHPAAEALEIWRQMGVPEVWVYSGRRRALSFRHLAPNGHYVEHPTSRAFPFLTAAEVLDWITQEQNEPENAWLRRLRHWVRDDLARRRGPAGG